MPHRCIDRQPFFTEQSRVVAAVREYVRATGSGESVGVDDIELTMDHFEQALEVVDSNTGPETGEFERVPEAV